MPVKNGGTAYMSYGSLKTSIIDHNLCTSCGLCVSVCPDKLLRFSDSYTVPIPVLESIGGQEYKKCSNCGLCEKVCAGYDSQTRASEKKLYGRTRIQEERWTGIYRNAYQTAAKDLNILQNASSGGAGTVLSMTALEEDLVDAMLVVGRDKTKPWISKALFADSAGDVIKYAQTTYCVTPNLHLLRENPYGRIGIIGLPCQIQGLRKLMNIKDNANAKKLSNKVVLLIELACSSNTTREGTEHIISNLMNIPLNNVLELRYRDGEYPGNLTVKTKDREKCYFPFYKMVEEFRKFKTFRCNTCPDWWSGLADISICDGATDIYALSKNGKEHKPTSTVLVRTDIGQKVVNLAYIKGQISLNNYSFSNNLGLERKRQRYRFYLANSDGRIPLPPGDISSAAFLLTAYLIRKDKIKSNITLNKIGINKTRIGYINQLKKMGGKIEFKNIGELSGEPVADIVCTQTDTLDSIEVDDIEEVQSFIDEIPLLAIAAAYANGTTILKECSELKDKDTNRIETVAQVLRRFGADVETSSSKIVVHGGSECISVSYPNFLGDLSYFADIRVIPC